MIKWEQTMEIKILRRQGKSLRQIAQETGFSVNTVRKYLVYEGVPRYQGRPRGMKKLAPYMAYLEQRVKGAHPIRLPACVLLREIQTRGYKGGISQLRSYMNTLKPAVSLEQLIRFETPPGQQMQVDWIEFRKGKNFLAAFVATLGYSRASYVHFVTNERLETLIECHEQAFAYFGGVTKQVLYDNMKTVILDRDAYGPGRHRFNGGMLDFARHYGFQLKVCRPYRAKTKGKVERFNGYLRYSFYNPLVTRLKMAGLLLDKDTANQEVLKWLREIANQRVHGTTKAIPTDCLEKEKVYLQLLPPPYQGTIIRTVPQESPNPLWSQEVLQHPLSVYQQLLEAL